MLSYGVESRVKFVELSYDVRVLQYSMNVVDCQMPTSGMVRFHPAACVSDDGSSLFAVTSTGELSTFSIANRIYRVSVPVTANGALSVCSQGANVYVGGGDGQIVWLTGADQQWQLVAKTQIDGRVTSLSLGANGLVAATSAGSVFLVAAGTDGNGQPFLQAKLNSQNPTAKVRSVAFPAANSERFATLSSNGVIQLWNPFIRKPMGRQRN